MRFSLLAAVLGLSLAMQADVLRSVGSLPAHIAGRFNEMTVCRQAPDGTFFVFDRRSHAVFRATASDDAPREIVQVGAEPGRIIRPYAFDLAPDSTFVVADAVMKQGRVQVFFPSGATLGGFSLPGDAAPLVVDGVVISGIASLAYSGTSVFVSRPEHGALITEYDLKGQPIRTFGELRSTGQEQDRELHLMLNSGVLALGPEGSIYFVFVAGTPAIRKYDKAGTLVFQRHIEGSELDDYMRSRPTVWRRRKTAEGEFPLVQPAVRAAAADASGNLWISLHVPYTYVYNARGDKQRVVQFRAAGIISPTNLSFTKAGKLLITPGCYLFETK